MDVDGEAAAGSGRRFDLRLQTRHPQYAIPDTVFHVLGNSLPDHLNQLVCATLQESDVATEAVEFDFLVEGSLLRLSLEDHLEEISASKEDFTYGERELLVEYFPKQAAPEPHKSLDHDDWISSVDVDSEFVISGCYDGTVQVWGLDGRHVMSIPAHAGSPVKSVAWISAKAVVASGVEGFDSKDRFFVTGSQDETLKVWRWSSSDATGVQCLSVCKGHTRTVNCVATNVDLIASGSMDCHLKIWALVSSDTEHSKRAKGDSKKQKGNDGDALAVRSAPVAKTPLVTLSGHKESITCVEWISDKSSAAAAPEVASGSMDNSIRIWDIEMSQVKQTIVGSKAFLSLSYSHARNAILSACTDRHVRLWDPRSKDDAQVAAAFTSHRGWVSSVAWSPNQDSLFVSGSYDASVKYWDVRAPNVPLFDLMGHKEKVLCVSWSNPRFIASGSADNMVKIFKNSS